MQNSLHRMLHEWKIEPAPDPDFRAAVWRRIEARRQRFSYRIWSRTETFVGQPVWAAMVFTVLVCAGVALGNAWQSRSLQQERVAGLRSYVLAVNPVAHVASLRQ